YTNRPAHGRCWGSSTNGEACLHIAVGVGQTLYRDGFVSDMRPAAETLNRSQRFRVERIERFGGNPRPPHLKILSFAHNRNLCRSSSFHQGAAWNCRSLDTKIGLWVYNSSTFGINARPPPVGLRLGHRRPWTTTLAQCASQKAHQPNYSFVGGAANEGEVCGSSRSIRHASRTLSSGSTSIAVRAWIAARAAAARSPRDSS